MGFLTNPASSKQKLKYAKVLIKGNRFICLILYIAGIVWLSLLGHKEFNNATYFSENALLPGLVYSEIKSDTLNYALNLMDELERERESHKSTTPHAWILAKMRQIGLETHSHNFTLNFPFSGGKVFKGKNVYGILRAPRIGSTESFVIATPYRPPDAVHPEITHSIPLLLAFANHARKQKYWAKDIIFLVTEQEQLGMQAWLEAYHGTENENNVLQSGTLDGRAGSMQAAINLEMQGFDNDFIDIKIEGLNGQLPNLDLVNLVQRIALKEGIASGHRQTSNRRRSGGKSKHIDNLKHMFGMILAQASGVPNGNHGLFHRYGIEALTLEGHGRETTNHQRKAQGALSILKLIEGTTRSVNNLLERFHQSYFFYLLVSTDRYVSIGDYMPSLALIVGALLVKALIVWLTINQVDDADDVHTKLESIDFNFIGVGKFLIGVHAIGFLITVLPFITPLNNLAHQSGIKTEHYLFGLFAFVTLFTMIIPFFVKFSYISIQILHIGALLELATTLLIVGMLNFSLGIILSITVAPFAIFASPQQGPCKSILRIVCILLHPLILTFVAVLGLTIYSFHELSASLLLAKALSATMGAITFSVVDSIIYGNWVFDLIAVIFFPIWLNFWNVLSCKTDDGGETKAKKEKLKTN